MKHILVILYHCRGMRLLYLLLLCALLAPAQTTQTGYAKTKGRMDSKGNLIPGTRIGGVSIQLTGGHSTVADANGDFTLTAPDQKFYLSDVQKQGYVLTDPDMLKKQYVCSSNPLVISMETKEKLADDQLAAERKLRRQLQKQLQQKEEEIDALKEENKITEEEYRQALQKLYAYQESNEKLVSDMAKRYSELDYDLLDEFYRQVSFCIENGDLVKADSLLRSRGDVSQQIKDAQKKAQALNEEKEKLQQAEAVLAADIDELGRRCYSYYEKFASQFENDSAFHYLMMRAALDTTKVEWQLDAGSFMLNYLAGYKHALVYYQRALRHALSQYGESHPYVMMCYNNIAIVYSHIGEYERALNYHQKSLTLRKSVYGESHPDVATCYGNIGNIYGELGDYAQELEYYQKAMGIRKAVYGENHPDVALNYSDLGIVYEDLGDYAQALDCHQKALAIRKSILGENHIDVATSYLNMGTVYANLEDFELASECFQKALAIQKTIYGEQHPDIAEIYNNLGLVCCSLGEYTQALEYTQKSLEIMKAFFGESHPNVAQIYGSIGVVYYDQGDYPHALEYYQKALALQKSFFGENHPEVAINYINIGEVYSCQKDSKLAMEYYQKSLDILKSVYGNDHPYIGLIYNNMGELHDVQGDYAQAKKYYQKALTILKSVFGETFPMAIEIENRIALLQKKMMAQKPSSMSQYVFTVTFDTDIEQGLSGEYVVLMFDKWTIESEESLFIIAEKMKGQTTTVLMMKDDVISRHTFEKGMDEPLDLKQVGKKEKTRIIELYHQGK